MHKERRGSQVVYGAVKEALDLFLVQVERYDVGEPGLGEHVRYQLTRYRPAVRHLTYHDQIEKKLISKLCF